MSAGVEDDGGPVSRAWQIWAAENLINGVPRPEVIAGLVAGGVPAADAEALVAALVLSPAFEAARPLAAEARRLRMLARLRQRLDRVAIDPAGVERRAGVSARELRDGYYATNTPVVLTDWVPPWRAFERWTPAYLRERFGAVEVPVTVDRDGDPDYDMRHQAHTRSMPLARFVDLIEGAGAGSNDFYMVANNRVLERTALGELLDDVALPPELFSPRALGASALWLGPAGTVTPLHHDTSNILFCQIFGRKRLRLVPPHETRLCQGARSMYAAVDPERDDLAGTLVKQVELAPGEALFIPVGWWHHVRALDASISLAFNNFVIDNQFDWYRPGEIT
jgi:hypothetical protein